MVYLDGAVLNTGSGMVAQLPSAARPTHTLYLTVGTGFTNNYPCTLQIDQEVIAEARRLTHEQPDQRHNDQ